jgi:hypothetical protein
MSRDLVYLSSDDPRSNETTPVLVETGDPANPQDDAAYKRMILGGGVALLGRWGEAGGPATIHAAYEITRRQLNGVTRLVDSLLVGKHSHRYGGNIAVLNATRSESLLGQRLVDPLVDEVSRPLHSAARFTQEIVSRTRAVDATGLAGRSAFVFERTLVGDVETDRMLLELRKRTDDDASDTGAWIGDARGQTWQVLANGQYFSRGGLFLMGDTAHAILRGGNVFVEYGGVVCVLGPGTNSDSPTGTSFAIACLGSTTQMGDLYGGSQDVVITGAASTLRVPRLIVAEQSTPSTPASGYGAFYFGTDSTPKAIADDGTVYSLGGGSLANALPVIHAVPTRSGLDVTGASHEVVWGALGGLYFPSGYTNLVANSYGTENDGGPDTPYVELRKLGGAISTALVFQWMVKIPPGFTGWEADAIRIRSRFSAWQTVNGVAQGETLKLEILDPDDFSTVLGTAKTRTIAYNSTEASYSWLTYTDTDLGSTFAEGDVVVIRLTITHHANGGDNDIYLRLAAVEINWTGEVADANAHDLLSARHSDTAAASPTRGAVIVGNSTPAWSRLSVGANRTFLRSDGTDTTFSAIQAADLPDLSGTYQPLDATLTALAGLATGADKFPYSTGADTFAQADLTAFARTLLDDANAGAVLSTLGVSAFVQTLLDDADAAAVRATIGAVVDHGGLTGLGDDDHSQYALLAGRASPQTLYGGTGGGAVLTLAGTPNSVPGYIRVLADTNVAINSVYEMLRLQSTTSGAMAAGAGHSITSFLEDSGGGVQQYGALEFVVTDPVSSSEDAKVVLKAVVAGTLTEVLTIDGTGIPVAQGGTGSTTAAGARTNLGAQAQDAYLDDIAALTLAKGDVLSFDGTDLARLAVGTNGQVLKANSSAATGLEWADETGGSGGGVPTASAWGADEHDADVTLVAGDDVLQVFRLTANRTCKLPAVSTSARWFLLVNRGPLAFTLKIADTFGNTLALLAPGETAWCLCDGTVWFVNVWSHVSGGTAAGYQIDAWGGDPTANGQIFGRHSVSSSALDSVYDQDAKGLVLTSGTLDRLCVAAQNNGDETWDVNVNNVSVGTVNVAGLTQVSGGDWFGVFDLGVALTAGDFITFDRNAQTSDLGDTRLYAVYRNTTSGRGWSATFGGDGIAGRYLIPHMAAATSTGATTLGPLTEIMLPDAVSDAQLAWTSQTADATTDLKIHVNSVVTETVTLTGAEGVVALAGDAYAAGDTVGVEFDAGTDPGDILVTLEFNRHGSLLLCWSGDAGTNANARLFFLNEQSGVSFAATTLAATDVDYGFPAPYGLLVSRYGFQGSAANASVDVLVNEVVVATIAPAAAEEVGDVDPPLRVSQGDVLAVAAESASAPGMRWTFAADVLE